MDRGAWRATVHGAAKSQTWLNDEATTYTNTHTHTQFRKLAMILDPQRVQSLSPRHFVAVTDASQLHTVMLFTLPPLLFLKILSLPQDSYQAFPLPGSPPDCPPLPSVPAACISAVLHCLWTCCFRLRTLEDRLLAFSERQPLPTA